MEPTGSFFLLLISIAVLINLFWFANHSRNAPSIAIAGTEIDSSYNDDFIIHRKPNPRRLVPIVDEDVMVLVENNLTQFIGRNRFVMVVFYAPWCGFSKALAPEYAAAATVLKGEVVLAKVDATKETELARIYRVSVFPTMYFFVNGVLYSKDDPRTKDGIVSLVKKIKGPNIYNLTTREKVESVLAAENRVVLVFLDSLVGPEKEELAAASRVEKDVKFYQTTSTAIAKSFHIYPHVKRPALVVVKQDTEKYIHFDGPFTRIAIADFVSANKLPLVNKLTYKNAPLIIESPLKKKLFLFASSIDSGDVIPTFQEAAKVFQGKLSFVYLETDDTYFGSEVSNKFGVTGDAPSVFAYTKNDTVMKYVLNGALTLYSIKSFAEDFLEDKIKPFYNSDPVLETNDGDVEMSVDNEFMDDFQDESKDVILEQVADIWKMIMNYFFGGTDDLHDH